MGIIFHSNSRDACSSIPALRLYPVLVAGIEKDATVSEQDTVILQYQTFSMLGDAREGLSNIAL